MPDPTDRRPPSLKFVVPALILIGAALRIWQYAANATLWLDEIALAQNILERPPWRLLAAPLSYAQSAPPGFLLAEKFAATVFGPGEYALRLFPLLCSLAALIVFRRAAGRALAGAAVPVALALFAAAAPLVFFAAQVKQYSTDVFAAVLLLSLAFDLEAEGGRSRRRALWTGAAGAAAVWFSQPAVFMAGGLGAALLLLRRRERRAPEGRSRAGLALASGLWGVSALAAVAAGLATLTPETRAHMRRFWSEAMPDSPLRALETLWPLRPMKALIGYGGAAALAYPAPIFYLALAALGLALLWRRRRAAALFIILPTGLTLAAAAARQYPFGDRLILFLLPGLFLAIAESVEWARRRAAKVSPVLGAAAVIALAGPALYRTAATPPVYRVQDLKPALAYMQARRRPGDAVYVYYNAGPSVTFYGARYGLGPGDYVTGGCHPREARRYLEEIDRFRGRPRLWLVAADVSWSRSSYEDIVRYLDTIGARRGDLVVPARTPSPWNVVPAGVFLYDLGDPARLARADAAAFPMPDRGRVPFWLRCDEGPVLVDPARRPAAGR